jgi:DNA modification methylase
MAKRKNNDGESLFPKESALAQGPVECLGTTFANDEDRRKHFLNILREKLKDPEFRKIEGFPIGSDEDILTLSDPPYYTACPNPFIEDFIKHYGKLYDPNKPYSRKPFCGFLKASERHPVYSFHPYHTKVPPDIIRHLVEHYTDPGNVVLDGFCGTGMTGVAAREAGRHVLINDLSPVATFISSVNTRSHKLTDAVGKLQQIISDSRKTWQHLYETTENGKQLAVNYFVWADLFTCPECVFEFPFFPHGVIHHGDKVETRKVFNCPSCHAELNVRRVERVVLREGKKKQLVWVNAGEGKLRINREPNAHDLALVRQIEETEILTWFPSDMIDPDGYSARLAQLGDKAITDISRFLSRRNLLVFSDLWTRISGIHDASTRNLCKAALTSIFTVVSERQGYFGGGGGMSGNLYMPIVRMEKNIYASLQRKIGKLEGAEESKTNLTAFGLTTTQSLTSLNSLPSNSIDYIYTDPPFGANIIYSEMNLLLEGWLKVKTNSSDEAVIDVARRKEFDDYARLMKAAFTQCYRALKPGRWITVEFHNTMASIWNLIQTAIGDSGFVVAQVDVFDKGSTTILADIRPGAAKLDLIISAYKPNGGLEDRFQLEAGTQAGVWDFVRTHLNQLPVFFSKEGQAEIIAERQNYLLFDRMVAFHVQRGVTVPLSAAEFYAGLVQRFSERDGMYFLSEQVAEYDKKRMTVREVLQLQLFVTDESSAIQWLKQQLFKKPQTFQELHPQFIKEIAGWEKYEKPLELSELLEQNFLRYDGRGEVPNQIHSYLSTNFKELRKLPKDDESLRSKGKDRWYIPDPNKAGDLEKLRERALLKEFWAYLPPGYEPAMKDTVQSLLPGFEPKLEVPRSKRMTVLRLEAVRAGFKFCWQSRDYRTIITVAQRIPEAVLQEDPKLLMWYDQAVTRLGS